MPSTPNSRSTRTAPSTTPAGNPPSHLSFVTNKSTTPAGPPPRSVYGSSFNPSDNTFARKNNSFEVPDDGYSDEDADGDIDDDNGDDLHIPSMPPNQSFISSIARSPQRGLKRSRDGKVREHSTMATIARGMTNRTNLRSLHEADDVILHTEHILADLDLRVQRNPAGASAVLTDASARLTKLWRQEANTTTNTGGVGPDASDSFTKANYLASLLLALHHPHTGASGKALVRTQQHFEVAQTGVSVPRALLDWLDVYHKPFADDYEAIRDSHPSPSAHESYWDVVYGNALRGKLDRVVVLLRTAGLEYAATARDDFEDDDAEGYTGGQLRNAEAVMRRCADVINACPGLRYNDWDLRNGEWRVFRQTIHTALDQLEILATSGADGLDQSRDNVFHRNLNQSDTSLQFASRRAASKIPWSIYENLRLLYGLLLGSPDEILMVSQDWLEGSIYMAVWWDGEDEDAYHASLSRSSLRRSEAQKPRAVDVSPLESYRERLASAFARVTEEQDSVFAVNTLDLLQVGLGCVLEDAVGAVTNILQRWSVPIAVAVVEIAALGRWLPLVRPRSRDARANMGLSKEDLLLLSTGPPPQADPEAIDRDELLMEYADLLTAKPHIGNKEGWELAIATLNRLDQSSDSSRKISDLLDEIDLVDEDRVDKVLRVCDELGQTERGRGIAERFADALAEKHESHGAALIYYARAHAASKLRAHIEVLTSMCLLHSASVPSMHEMDPKLESLLSPERRELKDLARRDMKAATLLTSYLSGYATLRGFYDARDQEIYAAQGRPIGRPFRSLERRRHAASALFAVTKSAADCIPGGLYDPEVESVIPVDGLLALFGEVLPLLGQDTCIFTQQQVFSLLSVVEDFVASPSRIRENADSLLSASLTAYQDGNSTASGIFKKPRSDLSASSSWDMMASVMAQSQGLGKIQRAWDWRQGLIGMGRSNLDTNAVVQLLREALVREVAGGWSGRLNW